MSLFNDPDLSRENELYVQREAARNSPVYLARRPIVEAILIANAILAAVGLVVSLVLHLLGAF